MQSAESPVQANILMLKSKGQVLGNIKSFSRGTSASRWRVEYIKTAAHINATSQKKYLCAL